MSESGRENLLSLPLATVALLSLTLPGTAEANGSTSATASRSFDGDTYSLHHQIGALIDSVFQCFSIHMSGTRDNTVTFDGMTELLDSYTDGNQPFVFEFETSEEGITSNVINSLSGGDLFPEGFEDPMTGTPLTDACVEIGIDDTLDSDVPVSVVAARLDFEGDTFGAFDITSAFSDPWDGRLSVVFPGFAGLAITGVELTIDTAPAGSHIFSDGFESGNTTSWSNQVP